MTSFPRQILSLLLISASMATAVSSADPTWKNLPSKVWIQSRRMLNFNSIFGSATRAEPYDRIAGHPVFQVTTPWGSPYLNMERKVDDEVVKPGDDRSVDNLLDGTGEMRQVSLFFMDPDDALSMHGELHQLEQLKDEDVRITCSSLAKALRQSSNLGNGLLTGFPVDRLTGKIKPVQEGGSLRYKIVPPKRQLYYAARCIGRERVGLMGDNAYEDAQAAIIGNSALGERNSIRRKEKKNRQGRPSAKTPLRAINAHMEGHTGIPVFYAPDMERKVPLLKRIVSGVPRETPLFFNYEDLEQAWSQMRKQNKKAGNVPEKPEVEVFNMWDVLSSMEREVFNKKQNTPFKEAAIRELKNRFKPATESPGLDSITFVPSSRSVQYKEHITARGNGKARLRPMR